MIEQTTIKHDHLMKQLTEPLLQRFGISYFCYQFVSNDGHWFTLGNHADWLLHSANNQFYCYDPSLVQPDYYHAAYACMPKYQKNDLLQETLVSHATRFFDIDHALALIQPTTTGCEYYFFGAPNAHCDVLNIYLNQLNTIRQDYTHFIKTRIEPIIDDCQNHMVNLKEVNSSRFNSKDNLLVQANPLIQDAFLTSINSARPLLTKRASTVLMGS